MASKKIRAGLPPVSENPWYNKPQYEYYPSTQDTLPTHKFNDKVVMKVSGQNGLFRLKLFEVQAKCPLSPGKKVKISPHRDSEDGTKTTFFLITVTLLYM